MFRSTTRRLAAPLRAFLLLACLLPIASCEKETPLPAEPIEGVSSSSQLIVFPDTPSLARTYDPGDLADCPDDDVLLRVEEVYATRPGEVHGLIVDFSAADQFEVFRRVEDEFLPLVDFTLPPLKRYPQGRADVFSFTDRAPTASPAYVARGAFGGAISSAAPRTNVGEVQEPVRSDLDYVAPSGLCPDFRSPPDSMLAMEWAPVPGAAGYWVHVYRFTDQTSQEVLKSGVPAPFYIGVTIDHFLGYFPASVTSYRIGEALPAGAQILTQKTMLNEQFYNVRISAVNDRGQLIAYTGETEALGVIPAETEFTTFPIGAALVRPQHINKPPLTRRVVCPPNPCPVTVPTSIEGLSIYPAGAGPRAYRQP